MESVLSAWISGWRIRQMIIDDNYLSLAGVTELTAEIDTDPLAINYVYSEPATFTATLSAESSENLRQMLSELYEPRDRFETVINRVQKRKHKKRRINKKWAKRYGYWEVVVDGVLESDVELRRVDGAIPEYSYTLDDIRIYKREV